MVGRCMPLLHLNLVGQVMLNSLEIKNFRALEDLKVARLGRVNLIVGKNNSGKSSILEALRIYAGGAQRGLLQEIAEPNHAPALQHLPCAVVDLTQAEMAVR